MCLLHSRAIRSFFSKSREKIKERFVHKQNLVFYRKMLAQTQDEAVRRQLLRLLAEEGAKDQQPSYKSKLPR